MSHAWNNWSLAQPSTHCGSFSPSTEKEIVDIVKKAYSEKTTVKVTGCGHSFNRIATPDGGYVVSLVNYKRTVKSDGFLVTFEAGIRLKEMFDRLWKLGLSLPNVPDILNLTLGGSVATNIAGTGPFPGYSASVRELRIICGDGSIRTCSREVDPDLFMAAAVGVGVMGLISHITLECVPAFKLKRVVGRRHVDDIVPNLRKYFCDEEKEGTYVYMVILNETPYDCEYSMEWFEKVDLDAHVEPEGGAWSARAVKGYLEPRNAVDRGYLVASKPISVFSELVGKPGWVSECFMDVNYAEDFVREWFEMQKTGKLAPYRPLVRDNFTEFRYAKADDLWLSPMYKRDTFKYDLAIASEHPGVADAYSKAFTELSLKYNARMHWGKVGWHSREENRKLFPKFDDFLIQRQLIDPTGVFLNDFTRPMFGDSESSKL